MTFTILKVQRESNKSNLFVVSNFTYLDLKKFFICTLSTSTWYNRLNFVIVDLHYFYLFYLNSSILQSYLCHDLFAGNILFNKFVPLDGFSKKYLIVDTYQKTKNGKQKCLTHSLLESFVTETILQGRNSVTKILKYSHKMKFFLQILQNSQKDICVGVSFLIKLQASGLRFATIEK